MTAAIYGGIAATAALSCAWDICRRRIPNALTLGSAALGVCVQTVDGGLPGLVYGLAGCVIGLALFLPWFLVRGMGGGDVKLLGAFGAWLGPVLIIWACLFAMVAGGVGAAIVLFVRRRQPPRAMRYALPVGMGVALALWLH
jgi:prepilin peptidase CpaA